MADKPVYTALIMAAGGGTRMHSGEKKQYMELNGMPVVCRSIAAFENNANIDNIVLVIPKGDAEKALMMCMQYGFRKVRTITEGSDERFKSVYNGLKSVPADTDYVLIHDGVRPLVTQDVIDRCCRYVMLTLACVAAVPVTDTIKTADPSGFARETLDRKLLWSIQTPQAFSFSLLKGAYDSLYKTIEEYGADTGRITDDAVIIENMTDKRVRIIKGDYRNIKITTPNDMIVAKAYLDAEKPRKEKAGEDGREAEARDTASQNNGLT